MLSPKITKDIIQRILKSTPGVDSNISVSDIKIEIDTLIYLSVSVKIDFMLVNVLETAKMIQKQIFYELTDKTDLRNFRIDIFIK